ncbi:MAG TPA: hypothetical protein VFG05_10040 [Methylocella sp.]|nr:hypothetical protein [Methylocella sp.]
MKDPKERLRDILEAIAAIARHQDRDRAAFERGEMMQVWFLRHLQDYRRGGPRPARGSAKPCARHSLAEDCRHAQHILVHGYFEIDTGIV